MSYTVILQKNGEVVFVAEGVTDPEPDFLIGSHLAGHGYAVKTKTGMCAVPDSIVSATTIEVRPIEEVEKMREIPAVLSGDDMKKIVSEIGYSAAASCTNLLIAYSVQSVKIAIGAEIDVKEVIRVEEAENAARLMRLI